MPTDDVGLGPPAMNNEPMNDDEDGRLKRKQDIRRQGERPDPKDPLTRVVVPVTTTVFPENIREDAQGHPNDTTLPGGRNENRDTIGFDPDELIGNPFEGELTL